MLGVNWEHHTAGINRSARLVKHMDDNFMVQILRQLTKKDALGFFLTKKVA